MFIELNYQVSVSATKLPPRLFESLIIKTNNDVLADS